MYNVLQILIGIAAIVGGASLLAIHGEEFKKHFQIQGDPIRGQGFIVEVKVIGDKSEIRYEFAEARKLKKYSGVSMVDGANFNILPIGAPTPIEYLNGNPEVNRHQFAHDEIYTRGRNVAVGAFLVLIGLALITGKIRSSKPVVAEESAG